MEIKPSPEFLAACRLVLGDDSPAAVIAAIRSDDQLPFHMINVVMHRDPTLWFCSAVDPEGIPRLWAKGASEQEAQKLAELAVTAERDRKQKHRHMPPRSAWTFWTFAPDGEKP